METTLMLQTPPSSPSKKLISTPPISPSSVFFVTFSPDSIQKIFKRGRQIGSLWSIQIDRLKSSHSSFEAIDHLRSLKELLREIDKFDRMRFCRNDIEIAVDMLKKNKRIWSKGLYDEVNLLLSTYFNENYFSWLPMILIQEIFQWLPLKDFTNLPCVSKEFSSLSSGNEVWEFLYTQRMKLINPISGPIHRCGCFKTQLQQRLNDPEIGDHVEVSWNGNFRLDGNCTYRGLAWWIAVIVDKHSSQQKFKVHYPGWDSRWDEWVIYTRLRPRVMRNEVESIKALDVVELWCCGSQVPGAWLESYVREVQENMYCIGNVSQTGDMWVSRDRLRLVKRPTETQIRTMRPSMRLRLLSGQLNDQDFSKCTIM